MLFTYILILETIYTLVTRTTVIIVRLTVVLEEVDTSGAMALIRYTATIEIAIVITY
jgi:hypothetical protein